MAKKIETYVDTSALIAFLDRSDTYHPLFFRLFADPPLLVTSPLAVAEGHGWFLRRYDRTRALQFIAMVESMRPLKVCSIGTKEQHSSYELLRKFADQNLTLTDAVGLYVMNDLGMKSCWSSGFHLGLTGVALVINAY
ncbi:MAG: hypothetical protein PVF82_18915 [Gammaproteobacteria bacterium]|jgi:predicted nucleic acid-binding protein